MAWQAHTNFEGVQAGTILSVVETPQAAGDARPSLPSGADLRIVYGSGLVEQAKVLSASTNEAVIEINGTQWRMTPQGPDELGAAVQTAMRSTDWVVREKIEEGQSTSSG